MDTENTAPDHKEIEMAHFASPVYKWLLASIISIFFLINLYTLTVIHNLVAIIPVVLQGKILLMIFKHHKKVRLLIKIWAAMMVIYGVIYWLRIWLTPNELIAAKSIRSTIQIAVGMAFFSSANRYVYLKKCCISEE